MIKSGFELRLVKENASKKTFCKYVYLKNANMKITLSTPTTAMVFFPLFPNLLLLINKHIKNNILNIIAKPNSPKTEIIGWDENKKALRIAVAAVPDKDKANAELLKFLKKETGSKCQIISGAKSREKKIKLS